MNITDTKIITYTVSSGRCHDATSIYMNSDGQFIKNNIFTSYIGEKVETVIHDEPHVLDNQDLINLYKRVMSFKDGTLDYRVVIKGHHPKIESILLPIIRDINIDIVID